MNRNTSIALLSLALLLTGCALKPRGEAATAVVPEARCIAGSVRVCNRHGVSEAECHCMHDNHLRQLTLHGHRNGL
ncbi:MAG: hypothetical protein AAFX58_11265 [Pseudomonadota bacterium]